VKNFCKTAAIGLCAAALFSVQAQIFVRSNLAGYYPNAEKRIVVMSSSDISAKPWKITDENGTVADEGKIGKSIAGKGDHSPLAFNYEVFFSKISKEGKYRFNIDGVEESYQIAVTKNPYSEAISSSLRWLRTQRSGTKDVLDRQPAHFGDSTAFVYYREGKEKDSEWSEDENGKTFDLMGGWYAGGDFTKMTSLIAYTSYCLIKAYNIAPESFSKKYSKSSLVDILDEAKFGLDYLLKVMPNDNDFIVNVGGYDSENGVRLPHEDIMEGKRTAYSILSSSDMGLAAAALAAGSAAFKSIDAAFAEKCKSQSIKIYNKIISEKLVPEWLEKDYPLHPDESDKDNLLLASAELYNLTGDADYLSKSKAYSDKLEAAGWAGWEVLNMPAQALIADKHNNAKKLFKEDLDDFLNNQNEQGNVWKLPLEYTVNGLYNCFVIGISAGLYEKAFGGNTYDGLVLDVLNYDFGLNNWGVSFTAVPSIKQSVKRFNLPVYKLQTRLFPEGAVSIGPCDREAHDEESKWILDDIRVNYCYPFNTKAVVFLDHYDDYMTMEARINGAAENIYLMTLANTIFGGK
jgi:hypothetical protein